MKEKAGNKGKRKASGSKPDQEQKANTPQVKENKNANSQQEKKPTTVPEKKGGNAKFFFISLFGIILLSVAIGLAVNFYKVPEKKLTLEEIVELQRLNPNDASLYCEEAKLLVKKKQLEEALTALEQCWERKSGQANHNLAIVSTLRSVNDTVNSN